jgi:ribokinase
MTITVVGSLNMDLIVRAARFPQPGETIHGRSFSTACGGKGANQAYAVARMGQPARMIGCVGDDSFADAMTANLHAAGVDTTGVLRKAGVSSGIAVITVDDSGQNEIVLAAGANALLDAAAVQVHAAQIQTSDAVIAQLETTLEATEAAMRLARASTGSASGTISIFNPAPGAPMPDELLALCDWVIPNETEAAVLTGMAVDGMDAAAKAARALKTRGARNVLVTLGSQGVWVDAAAWQGHVPAFAVTPVDTVAAGDTFIGAFASRLVEGASVQDAVRFGNAAAAIAVTRAGAQPSIPARAEVDAFLLK